SVFSAADLTVLAAVCGLGVSFRWCEGGGCVGRFVGGGSGCDVGVVVAVPHVKVSMYLVDLYRADVNCLEAACKLKLICLVRELVSSDMSMGQVVVLSGGLKAKEFISKNGIRNRPLLGGVGFGIFIGVPFIYGAFVL
ncbi:hypothetical protein A2U01_0007626, partial [Trifolium medium]|nr:hypothetical protein [Trifolium medium]